MAIAPNSETIVLAGSAAAALAGDSRGLTGRWVAELDLDLALLGCLQLGTRGLDRAADVAVDADGALHLMGYVNLGAWQAFARYQASQPAGSQHWATVTRAPYADNQSAAARLPDSCHLAVSVHDSSRSEILCYHARRRASTHSHRRDASP